MSMLAEVARAAGLDREHEHRAPVALQTRPVQAMAPKLNVVPLATPSRLNVTKEAQAYVAHLKAHCHPVTETEKVAIVAYAHAWERSPELRTEFGSFAVFASYMRGRKGSIMGGFTR